MLVYKLNNVKFGIDLCWDKLWYEFG